MIMKTPMKAFGPGKGCQSKSYKQPYKITPFSGSLKVGKGDFSELKDIRARKNIKIF